MDMDILYGKIHKLVHNIVINSVSFISEFTFTRSQMDMVKYEWDQYGYG